MMQAKKNNFFTKRVEEKNAKWLRNKTILMFVLFAFFIASSIFFWYWLNQQTKVQQALQPLRNTMELNEKIFGGAFDTAKLVKTFPVSEAEKKVRVNGKAGMDGTLTETNWQLNVIKNNGDTLKISLAELKKLPKLDIVFDFKCIEGWSQKTHWAGVSFGYFLKHYQLENEVKMNYVGMKTPDEKYYVGLDMKSAIHPQTILCYEMNGAALPQNQGFPLRLIIPVKYGVKHLKRIGTIFFSNSKPRDYWAERGYDYYAGH